MIRKNVFQNIVSHVKKGKAIGDVKQRNVETTIWKNYIKKKKPSHVFQSLDGEANVGKDKPVGKCPNASNPYHKCVEYCRTRWGSGTENNENEVCGVTGKMMKYKCTLGSVSWVTGQRKTYPVTTISQVLWFSSWLPMILYWDQYITILLS